MSASQSSVPQPTAPGVTDSALRVFTDSDYLTVGDECNYSDWKKQYGDYNRTEWENAPVPMHFATDGKPYLWEEYQAWYCSESNTGRARELWEMATQRLTISQSEISDFMRVRETHPQDLLEVAQPIASDTCTLQYLYAPLLRLRLRMSR